MTALATLIDDGRALAAHVEFLADLAIEAKDRAGAVFAGQAPQGGAA